LRRFLEGLVFKQLTANPIERVRCLYNGYVCMEKEEKTEYTHSY